MKDLSTWGKNIAVEDEDAEAKEALGFMLTSLRSNWKYMIGYVLIDKVNGNTLHSLCNLELSKDIEFEPLQWTVPTQTFLQCDCSDAN